MSVDCNAVVAAHAWRQHAFLLAITSKAHMIRPDRRRPPAATPILARAALRRRTLAIACGLLPALTSTVDAAGAPAPRLALRKSDQNSVKVLRNAQEDETTSDQKAPSPPEVSISGGLAYQRDAGDERTWATPFALTVTRGAWYYEVSGDGWARVDGDGSRQRGFSDVSIVVNRTFAWRHQQFALVPEVELVVPSHGAVGSSGATQIGRLSFAFDRKIWALSLRAAVARDSEVSDGASRYTRYASAKLLFVSPSNPDQGIALQFRRTFARTGGAAATDLRAVADFPLAQAGAWPGCSKWLGSVALSRSLTSTTGSRFEFAVNCVL